MTRIREKGPRIVIGARERDALSRYFGGQPGIVAAYLFGSQARGTAGPLSDVDVAVWLDPELPREARWQRRLELMGGAGEAVGTDELQVVVLNDAPPLLAHRVIGDGKRLNDADPPRRVTLETAALILYLDTLPLREAVGRGLRRRMEDGTYGRPSGG